MAKCLITQKFEGVVLKARKISNRMSKPHTNYHTQAETPEISVMFTKLVSENIIYLDTLFNNYPLSRELMI